MGDYKQFDSCAYGLLIYFIITFTLAVMLFMPFWFFIELSMVEKIILLILDIGVALFIADNFYRYFPLKVIIDKKTIYFRTLFKEEKYLVSNIESIAEINGKFSYIFTLKKEGRIIRRLISYFNIKNTDEIVKYLNKINRH